MVNTSFSPVQYEALATNQVQVMTEFFDKHRIDHVDNESFQNANGYVAFKGEISYQQGGEYTPEISREASLSHYTVDEIRFVLDTLDMEFEREVLHYTYDDVEEYIAERIAGRKPYAGAPTLTDPVLLERRKSLIESYAKDELHRTQYDCL